MLGRAEHRTDYKSSDSVPQSATTLYQIAKESSITNAAGETIELMRGDRHDEPFGEVNLRMGALTYGSPQLVMRGAPVKCKTIPLSRM